MLIDRNKVIIKTSFYGIIVNIILVVFKIIVGAITNSIAIISDAINNLTDAGSSVITIIGTKFANRRPDKKHPYGYGRIEYFTSVIISIFILIAGISAGKSSIDKIINPEDTTYSVVTLIIIAVAVVTKFIFGRYVKKTGNDMNSQSLIASGQDALLDSILSCTTLIAGVINFAYGLKLEGFFGLVISFVIINSAIDMSINTVNSILGERVEDDLIKKLKDRVSSFDEVQGVYDLNFHDYGPSKIIASIHIQIRNDMTAEEIHILTREIEYVIYEEFGIILTIGIYAANDKGTFGKIKKEIEKLVGQYDSIVQFHGFYVDKAKYNIYFDIVFDFEEENKEQIVNEIVAKMKEKHKKYNFNVIVDSNISEE